MSYKGIKIILNIKIKKGIITPVNIVQIRLNLFMPENKNNKQETKEEIEFKKFLKELGVFIRMKRKALGYKSAEPFANSIDMDPDQLRKYERGEIPMNLTTLHRILKGLKTSGEDTIKHLANFQEVTTTTKNQPLTEEAETYVRLQVKTLNGSETETTLRPEDIQRIGGILIAAFNLSKKNEIVKKVGLSSKSKNFNTVFDIALTNKWIAMQYPESPKRHDQKYYTTEAGKKVLRLAGD